MNDAQIRDAKVRAWDEVKRLVTEAAASVRSRVAPEVSVDRSLRSPERPSPSARVMPPEANLVPAVQADTLEMVRDAMEAAVVLEGSYGQQLEALRTIAGEQDE